MAEVSYFHGQDIRYTLLLKGSCEVVVIDNLWALFGACDDGYQLSTEELGSGLVIKCLPMLPLFLNRSEPNRHLRRPETGYCHAAHHRIGYVHKFLLGQMVKQALVYTDTREDLTGSARPTGLIAHKSVDLLGEFRILLQQTMHVIADLEQCLSVLVSLLRLFIGSRRSYLLADHNN